MVPKIKRTELKILIDHQEQERVREAAFAVLRETQQRLSVAQSVARIGSWEFDVETGAISWSAETFRLLQFDPEKGPPDFETLQQRYHPDDHAAHAAVVQRSAATGTPYEIDLRAVLNDGTIRWLYVSGQTLRDRDNGVVRLFGIVQDITERKAANEALAASEERYRRIIETASEGIWNTDAEGHTVLMNSKMAEMLGYPPEELIGKRIRSLVSEKYIDVMWQGLERRRQGISETYEVKLRHRERGDFWAKISASPVFGSSGAFEGSLVMVTDISERKRQEAALQESEARFRSTFDDAAIGMTINSVDGILLQVNDAFCRFVGHTRESLIGRHIATLTDSETMDRIQELRERCLAGEIASYRREKIYRHKDGRPIWADLTSSIVRDSQSGEPLYFIAQISDITARKRLEQQMIQSEKLASLGELVAGVAHEINNPLSVISGQAQLLEMHDDSQVREDARVIREMTVRASRIVRSLRSYSQPSDISAAERMTLTDLNRVVQTALEVMTYNLRDADILLETELPDSLIAVPMNAGEIEQVLVNLLSNAAHVLRDLPEERRLIHIRTWNTTSAIPSEGPDSIALSVTDQGIGMSPEIAVRVFDPFFTTKDTDEGTGLGLYISHSIITAHGGTLSVESTEGTGTTFTVCLPCG